MSNEFWLAPLVFDGATMDIFSLGGAAYVAIAPICRALGVDSQRQVQRLRKHPLFSAGLTQMAGGKQEVYPLDVYVN